MKRFISIFCVIALIGCLAGCGTSLQEQVENTPETSNPSQEYHDALKGETSSDPAPVNYMDEIKAEIHDELFREASEETLDIIDRIFKHLEIETVTSSVDGNDASVLMNITTVNAGKAWVIGMERYAIACAENLFAENYDDDATLYSYYLDEFESCVRYTDYITMPVVVEMDYHNHRWEWDLDDDVVNAITGQLLAAIEGDLNSSNILKTKEEINVPSEDTAEVNHENVKFEQNNSPVSITGYDISTNADKKECLVVKYSWINTTNKTTAYWLEFSDRAFQNGIELNSSYPGYKNKYDELYSNLTREIRPGTSIEFVRFFELRDPSNPSNIEVESYDAWTNTIYASGISTF